MYSAVYSTLSYCVVISFCSSGMGTARAPTCYRGDQSMVALSSALVLKMLTLLPTLLKVIAAKAVFGILMGVVSVILSKMAILPLVLSYANKNINQQHSHIAPSISSSFRQGESILLYIAERRWVLISGGRAIHCEVRGNVSAQLWVGNLDLEDWTSPRPMTSSRWSIDPYSRRPPVFSKYNQGEVPHRFSRDVDFGMTPTPKS